MLNHVIEILRHHDSPQTVLGRKYPRFAPFDIQAAIEYAKGQPDAAHIIPFIVGAGLNAHQRQIYWLTTYNRFKKSRLNHMGSYVTYPTTDLHYSTDWSAVGNPIHAKSTQTGIELTIECRDDFDEEHVTLTQLYVGAICYHLENVQTYQHLTSFRVDCAWSDVSSMCKQLESYLMDKTFYNKKDGPSLLVQEYAQSAFNLSPERLRVCHEEGHPHLLLY